MSPPGIAVLSTGVVSSVGLTAPSTCAALRAKVSNPSLTAFVDRAGKPIMAHQAALDRPWRGVPKLARMAAMAVEEALDGVTAEQRRDIPLLLCVAEQGRPGRLRGLDAELFGQLQALTGTQFSKASRIVPKGRISVALALSQSRSMIEQDAVPRVLIVAVDSLLVGQTLARFADQGRLLTEDNSNGFMPGEAAGAILVGRPKAGDGRPVCLGFGFGVEHAHIESEEPLRADGMATAVKNALTESAAEADEVACRITDLAGEQYYFKEATLAFSRTLRNRRENLELWHPAETIGEVGAASGAICVAAACAAASKRYLPPGRRVLLHFANDQGDRAAVVMGLGA